MHQKSKSKQCNAVKTNKNHKNKRTKPAKLQAVGSYLIYTAHAPPIMYFVPSIKIANDLQAAIATAIHQPQSSLYKPAVAMCHARRHMQERSTVNRMKPSTPFPTPRPLRSKQQ